MVALIQVLKTILNVLCSIIDKDFGINDGDHIFSRLTNFPICDLFQISLSGDT